MTLPTLFVSHGPPTLIIEDVPSARFLRGLGATLEAPESRELTMEGKYKADDERLLFPLAFSPKIATLLQDPVRSSARGYRAARNPEIVIFLILTMFLWFSPLHFQRLLERVNAVNHFLIFVSAHGVKGGGAPEDPKQVCKGLKLNDILRVIKALLDPDLRVDKKLP